MLSYRARVGCFPLLLYTTYLVFDVHSMHCKRMCYILAAMEALEKAK